VHKVTLIGLIAVPRRQAKKKQVNSRKTNYREIPVSVGPSLLSYRWGKGVRPTMQSDGNTTVGPPLGAPGWVGVWVGECGGEDVVVWIYKQGSFIGG